MKNKSTPPVLIEVTRGDQVESRHRGHIIIMDAAGQRRQGLGDPEALVCMRSLAKPFQALPVLTTGAAAAVGIGPAELALFSGSISGQDFQTELVTQVLTRIGLTPAALQCGVHPPLHRDTAKALGQAGLKPTALHHTCAGKHAGMLSLCVHHGWPVENYLALDHPVQLLIRRTLARMVGLPPEKIPVAIDGCSAPTFYMPLQNIALGYARLAAAQPDSPAGVLLAAILAHPRHIAGDGRLETVAMEALPGRLFAKSGAEGGYALTVVQEGLGVALKVEDGSQRALNPAVVAILEQLGLISPEAPEALGRFREPQILNHRKLEVGRIAPSFNLEG